MKITREDFDIAKLTKNEVSLLIEDLYNDFLKDDLIKLGIIIDLDRFMTYTRAYLDKNFEDDHMLELEKDIILG